MSMFPFAKNFFAAQGGRVVASVTTALVQLDPEGASAADLRTMEEDLDKAGRMIARLRGELGKEQREYDGVKHKYAELMGAAEILQKRIETATGDQKSDLERSLSKLVDKIEETAPELERERQDADSTQKLLNEAEAAYAQKARALSTAKSNLDRARHDLQHANIQEERARQKANDAAVVAGLRNAPQSGLTVALSTMQASADAARVRAEASDMKAAALRGADTAGEDENVAAALKAVRGEAESPKSLTDRLAALKRVS